MKHARNIIDAFWQTFVPYFAIALVLTWATVSSVAAFSGMR